MNKCYIGGSITVNGNEITASFASDRLNGLMVRPSYTVADWALNDCHIDLDFLNTYGAAQNKLYHYFLGRSGVHTRVYNSSKLLGYTLVSTDTSTNTNVFGITGNPVPGVTTIRPGVTLLSEAQSQDPASFTNFDFTNVWQQAVDGTPKLRVTEYELANVISQVLNTATGTQVTLSTFDVIVNLFQTLPDGATLKCYASQTQVGIENNDNLITQEKIDDYNYTFHGIGNGAGIKMYYLVVYEYSAQRQTLSGHIGQTTIINIVGTPENYRALPLVHRWNHGLISHDGYIYGSARGRFT